MNFTADYDSHSKFYLFNEKAENFLFSAFLLTFIFRFITYSYNNEKGHV